MKKYIALFITFALFAVTFGVSAETRNAFTPSQVWTYDATNQGWWASGVTGFTWAAGGTVGGTISNSDPQIYSAAALGVGISNNKTIELRYKNSTTDTSAKFYFITNADPTWNEAKAKTFAVAANSDYTVYTVDMSGVSGWTGTLNTLRFDPAGVSGSFRLDYIEIGADVTPTPFPTADPSLCADGSGFPFYPMCPNVSYPVTVYNAGSMTATWNPTTQNFDGMTVSGGTQTGAQTFGRDITCGGVSGFGNQALYTQLGAGVGLVDMIAVAPSNNGPQVILGEVHNDYGKYAYPEPVVALNAPAGTVINSNGPFWTYADNTSKACANATVLVTNTYMSSFKVTAYGSFSLAGHTYTDAQIDTLWEQSVASGLGGPDTVYLYVYQRNYGNVVTCWGNIGSGNAVSGSCLFATP